MKAIINGVSYPCTGYSNKGDARFTIPDEKPETVAGIISLESDEGFQLAEVDAGSYLRSYWSGDVLVLTNTPEPEPIPEPEPVDPEPTTEEILLEIAADHEARLCNIELGV